MAAVRTALCDLEHPAELSLSCVSGPQNSIQLYKLETTNIEPKTSLVRAEHRRIASSDLPSTPSRLPDGCGDHPRPDRSLAPVAASATVTLRAAPPAAARRRHPGDPSWLGGGGTWLHGGVTSRFEAG
eukprot:SAG22_NODE_1251_length_5005_cov_22.891154_4_plen_128_part_00